MFKIYMAGLLILCIIISIPVLGQENEQVKIQRGNRSSIRGKITYNIKGISEALQGASVFVSDLKLGAITNHAGEYSLANVSPGRHLVEISHIGFITIAEYVNVSGDLVRDFILAESIVENNEVVITGVGTATQSRRSAIPVMVVRKEELYRSASTNIIEALTHKPGISSVTTGPGISKPVIRGVGSNRIITMNDGIKQEGQQWGDEHGIEIDEASVNKVEILKGPAALIYGSDALGGVINIFTNVPVAEGTVRGNLFGNYQSNNALRSFYGNLAGNLKGVSWNFYSSTLRAADYENKNDGKVFNSKFKQDNYGGYAGYNSALGYSHLIFSSFNEQLGIVEGDRDDQGYFVKPIAGGGIERAGGDDFNSTIPGIPYQDIQHTKIAFDNSYRIKKSRVKFTGGYQRNKRKEFADIDAPQQEGLFFDLQTYTYRAQFQFPELHNWNTSIGINGLNQVNHNKGLEVLIPEYTMNDLGMYAYVSKTIRDISFSGGVRYDNRVLDSKELIEGANTKFKRFTKKFSNFSGSVGASIRLDSALTLKLNVARGFRSPSISELASNGTHEGTNRYEYGDENIGSETSIQFDGSLEYNTDHFSFVVNAFRNDFDNFIFYRKLSSLSGGDSLVNVNGNNLTAFKFDQQVATLSGFEVKLDLHPHPLDWLHIENTFSFVRGNLKKLVEGAHSLPFIPAPRIISELRGDFLKNKEKLRNLYFKLELDHTFTQDRIFHAFDTETYTNGYTLFNMGIGADILGKKKNVVMSLHFFANNLTDVAWQSHLSRLKYASVNNVTGNRGVYNMGRNFSFKVNIPFTIK
ncbi:MAG: TonB-dependent receptor [Chitinophagaceae bacterium]